MGYGHSVDKVLEGINAVTPVDVEEYDSTNEWFLLESEDLSDHDLYQLLRLKWFHLVGPNYGRFALIYCLQRPDCGVWLHSFAASESPSQFAPGCFQVSSWT